MDKNLTQQIEEDETLDYHLKEWELFKEETFLKEYQDKGEKENGER